ncbi:GbsR/MarR family transcriptional regulator [Streptomyces gardneri]|uniref:MarR family transcriptional regulator n=1 Tax=Streptomyces gardneri TaxID=66892 RepID=A0A4Y3RJC5_9ACTN|nr:helix-turn-helix domain-containing protein [Streptomyces gardneri]GEB57018.1 MarR family transcriptional regulator [Streptomyces gardneri]GHH16899.1 MarR family transcriptional regulator [Streptomyces gardneri]
MPGDRLTLQDRLQIAAGLREELTYAAIGRLVGRPTSTVTREVMRNGGPRNYRADAAHRAGTRPTRQRRTTAPTSSPGRAGPGGRDPRLVEEADTQSMELMVQAGLPQMMARVLAALFTTDSGSLTSAELVRRLHVSPASISKAIGYLETQALVKRERDDHSRAERYAIDDDVAFQSIMAGARNQTQIAEACKTAARKLGTTTPAGARLENTSQFLLHVIDDLVRSAQHWHTIYPTHPRNTSETDD